MTVRLITANVRTLANWQVQGSKLVSSWPSGFLRRWQHLLFGGGQEKCLRIWPKNNSRQRMLCSKLLVNDAELYFKFSMPKILIHFSGYDKKISDSISDIEINNKVNNSKKKWQGK